jgi:energy-coupling factor transport system permease protein
MSSRFEFLGSTSLGQYLPRQSWFHARDPRARLLALSTLFIGVVFAPSLWALGGALGCVLVIYLIARLPLRPAWNGIKKAIIFILILAVLQIFFFRAADPGAVLWTLFGFEVAQAAVQSAAMLVVKFVVLIALINALVMTLSTSQVTTALFYLLKPLEVIRFPVNDLTMVVQITLRYIPLIAEIAEKTAKAQASRGGDWEQRGFNPIRQVKRVLPLIVPLIVTSLKRAETMAMAMESRGFNAAEHRSSYYDLNFIWQDGLLITVSLIMSLLLVLSGRFL